MPFPKRGRRRAPGEHSREIDLAQHRPAEHESSDAEVIPALARQAILDESAKKLRSLYYFTAEDAEGKKLWNQRKYCFRHSDS